MQPPKWFVILLSWAECFQAASTYLSHPNIFLFSYFQNIKNVLLLKLRLKSRKNFTTSRLFLGMLFECYIAVFLSLSSFVSYPLKRNSVTSHIQSCCTFMWRRDFDPNNLSLTFFTQCLRGQFFCWYIGSSARPKAVLSLPWPPMAMRRVTQGS